MQRTQRSQASTLRVHDAGRRGDRHDVPAQAACVGIASTVGQDNDWRLTEALLALDEHSELVAVASAGVEPEEPGEALLLEELGLERERGREAAERAPRGLRRRPVVEQLSRLLGHVNGSRSRANARIAEMR